MLLHTTAHVLSILVAPIVADKNGLTRAPNLGILLHTAIVVIVLISHVAAVNNGLARVPQLGWVWAILKIQLHLANFECRIIGML
jgi:hypothetical protein